MSTVPPKADMAARPECPLKGQSGHVARLSTLVRMAIQIVLLFAPRVRVAIASALECDREPSAALRNSLPLPLERQLFDIRAL